MVELPLRVMSRRRGSRWRKEAPPHPAGLQYLVPGWSSARGTLLAQSRLGAGLARTGRAARSSHKCPAAWLLAKNDRPEL